MILVIVGILFARSKKKTMFLSVSYAYFPSFFLLKILFVILDFFESEFYTYYKIKR